MSDDGNQHEPLNCDDEEWPTRHVNVVDNVHVLSFARHRPAPGPAVPKSEILVRRPDATQSYDTDLWARHILAPGQNPLIRQLLTDATTGIGCTLTTSDHVEAVMRCATQCDGRASLLAITLARMNGLDAMLDDLTRLRQNNPDLPVLLLADRPSMARIGQRMASLCDFALPVPATAQRVHLGLHIAIKNSEERISV